MTSNNWSEKLFTVEEGTAYTDAIWPVRMWMWKSAVAFLMSFDLGTKKRENYFSFHLNIYFSLSPYCTYRNGEAPKLGGTMLTSEKK